MAPDPLPEQFGFKTDYFTLPGLRMHAATAGPEDGPLVLLLHGFPEFWGSWRRQIGPLARAGYRVVAPDQRGYNLTDKTGPYDVLTLANDVVALMDLCSAPQVLLAGHDWGAAVAWVLAGRYPERVKKLAIVNLPHPAPMVRALRGRILRQTLMSWYIFFFQIPRLPEWLLSRNDFAAMRRMMRASAMPGTFSEEDLDHYRDTWARPGALTAMIGWYRALLQQSPKGGDTRRLALSRIPMPTLMLWGERDPALHVDLAVESLRWLDQGRLIRFPQATHWLHEDLPGEVTRLLMEHFAP
jgi:pimeloyl-ACP methyl ester carboxylesterase